jgi:hypothetical protein
MFCNYCGKELADGAKFCNYCGAQTAAPQAQPASQPAPQPVFEPLSQVPAQPEQTAQQPQEKKKGNWLVTAIVALVVFFVVRSCTTNALTGNSGSSGSSYGSSYTTSSNQPGQSNGLINLSSKPSPVSGCLYGALYRNGTLTYGSARLRLSGYHLLDGENGGTDFLMSSDESVLLTVNKSVEVNVSYDASDESGMLASFSGSSFSNVKMVSFKKYTVDGYPVIRYIVRCTESGVDQYIGELIVFPAKTANELMRINMYALAEAGTAPIDRVFDTLSISPDYALGTGETEDFGINQITAK